MLVRLRNKCFTLGSQPRVIKTPRFLSSHSRRTTYSRRREGENGVIMKRIFSSSGSYTAHHCHPLRLSRSLASVGLLGTRENSIYVTGLMISATMCTSFRSSQIRRPWLKRVEIWLTSGVDQVVISSGWMTVLGISNLLEYRRNWRASLSSLISSSMRNWIRIRSTSSPIRKTIVVCKPRYYFLFLF